MRIRALLLSSKMRKMRQKERQDKTRFAFFHHEKKTTIKFDSSRGRVPQNPENLSVSSRHLHATWCFDFIRFSFKSLSLSFTLARFFQNRDDDDDVFVDDDDFSLSLFREDAFTIGANEKKNKNESTHHRPSGVGTDAIVLRREGRLSP